jgi:hypothetical protein
MTGAMPFPLVVGATALPDPPTLARVAAEDARDGGVLDGRPVHVWVLDLVRRGELDRALAHGLCAVLIRSGTAEVVAEGARLARALGDPPMARLLQLAAEGLDAGVLLHPAGAEGSVEDVVLRGWVAIAEFDDPAVRARVLEKLRYAGLAREELRVLLLWGDDDELARWIPAIRAEGLGFDPAPLLAEAEAAGRSAAVAAFGQ